MNALRSLAALAIAASFLACAARAAQNVSGTWELQRETNTPYLYLQLTSEQGGRRSSHPGGLRAADLGLTDARIDGASGEAQFSLKRAAGTFSFSGTVGNGRGGGVFTFAPDDGFVRGLSDRGFAQRDANDVVTAAMVDLTLPYIDSIRSSGYGSISFGHLLAFRALHVTPQSIAELRSIFGTVSEENVITTSALGVTKAYVEEMRRMGVANVTPQRAVQFKAMHIDAAYIKHLADHGLKNLTPEQIVEAKATGL